MKALHTMMSSLRPIARHHVLTLAAAALALLLLPAAAGAQIALSGSVFDGSGGPLLSGTVYTSTGFNVPTNQTLTVQAGAIVKFNGGQLTVNGTLDVNGTVGSNAYFTSIADDTIGGDTNGDLGVTVPAPGNWQGIVVNTTAAATTIDRATIRYTGSGGWSGIYFNGPGGNISVTNTTISNGSFHAIDLNGVAAFPTISNCNFTGHSQVAVEQCPIDSVPGFANNTASGNTGGDFIFVTDFTPDADVTITAPNCMNGALVVPSGGSIPVGVTLTLEDDVVIKLQAGLLTVSGTLLLSGSSADPVVLTAYADDSYAGDTNKNGLSSGAPGAWQGLAFNTTAAASVLSHAVIRYTGSGGWSGIYFNQAGANITVTNSTISDGSFHAIDFNELAVFPTVSNCNFTGHSQVAVQQCPIDSVPGFTNNNASGNTGGDFILVTDFTPAGNVTITAPNCMNGALVIPSGGSIPVGVTLTLEDDVVIKLQTGLLTVSGTLLLSGSAADPVVLTAYADDSFAGDTNKNGPSSGAPGAWQGLAFNTTGAASVLDNAVIRYTGSGGWSGIYMNQAGANITVTNCTFSDGSLHAVDLNALAVFPTFSNCEFTGHSQVAVQQCAIDSVPGFTDNTASGNLGGNFIYVTDASPAQDTLVVRSNCLNGALVFAGGGTVPAGVTLTLDAGVVIKVQTGQLAMSGSLQVLGTAERPVVFTAYADDSIAGDTNLNGGATSPAAGAWQGLAFNAGSDPCDVEHLLLRYVGAGGWAGIVGNSAALNLRKVRVERGAVEGFLMSALAGVGEDWTAYACGTGIRLTNGAFGIHRATAANCTGAGIVDSGGFTGAVRGSIAWGNGGGGFSGLVAGQVHYSDGPGIPAGGTANINADPLFVDAANGNLRILAASPCRDTGDPADLPSGQDTSGFPRLMDGNLDTVRRIDMGAFEFDNVELAVTGSATPGGTLTFTTTGNAALGNVFMFIGLGAGEANLKTYGPVLVDLTSFYLIVSWPAVPSTVPLGIPLTIPTPLPIVCQELGRTGAAPGLPGNLSNPVSFTIE